MDRRFEAGVLFVYLAATVPATGMDYPLSSSAIREAYFLGRNPSGSSVSFFDPYTHYLPKPVTGAHISAITIDTPFALVAEEAGQSINSSAQDAEDEYLAKPGGFRVRIEIDFTPTYRGRRVTSDSLGVHIAPADFWNDFQIKVSQGDKQIQPRSVQGTPLYTGEHSLFGAVVSLDFDPTRIESAPMKIQVIVPDGQRVEDRFDLTKLR